eukprot:8795791-Prorocentrum_lima.AAC.1
MGNIRSCAVSVLGMPCPSAAKVQMVWPARPTLHLCSWGTRPLARWVSATIGLGGGACRWSRNVSVSVVSVRVCPVALTVCPCWSHCCMSCRWWLAKRTRNIRSRLWVTGWVAMHVWIETCAPCSAKVRTATATST